MATRAELIQQVRFEVADIDPALPILSDDIYDYILTKQSESIARSSLDAARMILLRLAQSGDETVDIFSIKGSRAAAEYREALKLFVSNPSLNPILNQANAKLFLGGTLESQNQANLNNSDNVQIEKPSETTLSFLTGLSFSSDPFKI